MSGVRRERSLADVLAEMKQDSRVALTSRKIPDNALLNHIRSIPETAPAPVDTVATATATGYQLDGPGGGKAGFYLDVSITGSGELDF